VTRHRLRGQNLGYLVANGDRVGVGQGINGIEEFKDDLRTLLLGRGRAGDVIVNEVIELP
jgi:hypothetical protein